MAGRFWLRQQDLRAGGSGGLQKVSLTKSSPLARGFVPPPFGFLGVALRSISTCLSQLESDSKNSDRETLLEPPTSFKCDKRGKKIQRERRLLQGFGWSLRMGAEVCLAFGSYVNLTKAP